MLFAIALENQHHDIAGRESGTVGGQVEWGIKRHRLLIAHVVGNDKRRLLQCAEDGKRCV